MSNYKFGLDMYTDNANADIIKQIKEGSEVLEFGSAYGRMTKYLTEELNCAVDIVEIDEESGRQAAHYARNVCLGKNDGDINKGLWETKLQGNLYDAIVFTDVLEHLIDAKRTLQESTLFLKEGGCILCSVPNIAHASVLLGLLHGKFRYTGTGLLDKTHIHFFTEESFKEMAAEAGLFAAYEHAIVVPVGTNEIPYDYSMVSKDVENALKKRANNEAYQYIFKLIKESSVTDKNTLRVMQPPQGRVSVCYIKESTDADFSEEKEFIQNVRPDEVDVYVPLDDFPDAVAVRYRFLDSNCVVRLQGIWAVTADGEEAREAYNTVGVSVGEGLYIFPEDDASLYMWLDAKKACKALHFRYEILVYNSDVLTILGKEVETDLCKQREKCALLNDNFEQAQTACQQANQQCNLLEEKNLSLQQNRQELEKENEALKQQCEEKILLRDVIAHRDLLQQQLNDNLELQKKNELHLDDVEQDRIRLYRVIEQLNSQIAQDEGSLSWKLCAPLRWVGTGIGKISVLFGNTVFFLKHYGLKASLYRALHYKEIKATEARQQAQVAEEAQKLSAWEELSAWIDTTPHEFIDIFPVPMGWNTPLFQRFQHLSLQAGNAGGISFYGAHPAVDKDVETYKFITPTLCIVNLECQEVVDNFWRVLDKKQGLKFLRIQSIDLATSIEKIENYMQRGYQIVYEYIDELTPQITGNIPAFVFERHEYLLRNEEITVVATSDKLFNQVKPYRENNMVMLNNGVDYDHWHLNREEVDCPEDLKSIVAQGKIIVGYHGALAQWVDYELLKRIAEDDRFILMLIGFEHDNHLKESKILSKKNVYFLGARGYQQLNSYAIFYDIAILPFVVNNITLSVSPVKIFEYMAAGKPVVSYALPECKKYKSCLCADTQDEFIELVNKAVELRTDTEYLKQLDEDAKANTWETITKKMVSYVREGYQRTLEQRQAEKLLNPELPLADKDAYLEEVLRNPKYIDKQYYRPITEKPYSREKNDCKVIAYYLTQFHPDPHNEEWWGRGTTEWNNVCRAVPQYEGHYQPRLPGELGFYDLRIADNMKRQIELAKMYGVYGFSFYYYWFNGDRLLEQPLEAFLDNKELDFPFSLCWANENWTKRFDGTNMDILIEQPNTVESYKNVIEDMARFLRDSRYITVNGCKVITVYRPSLMPDAKSVLRYWREYCREQGIGELHLVAVKENQIDINWLKGGYDAVSEFHPGTLYTNCLNITKQLKYLRKDFAGEVFSYPDIVRNQKYFRYDLPKLYRAVMPMWDNTARRDNKGMIFQGATPALYKRWLKDVITAGQKRDDLEDNLIFINAWNEWGEGAYLEPDKRYGYAYLEATKEAVEDGREN